MTAFKSFEEIIAWQTARQPSRLVYSIRFAGDSGHDFDLRSQMRRACVSIMSNIAEGFESRTTAQFIEYLGRAKASCAELRSQTYIALDAGYVQQAQFDELQQNGLQCGRQLHGLMQYLLKHPESLRVREAGIEYVVD